MWRNTRSRQSSTGVTISCVLLAASLSWVSRLPSGQLPPGVFSLDTFEQYGDQDFPAKWRGRNIDARNIYQVESENGNRFLRARANKQAVQIGLEYMFDPKQQRWLSWRWRVHEFPAGADERDADKHDAAAQVYVVFDNQYWPRVIKYIWSLELPVGMRFTNPLYGRGQVIVLRSGQGQRHRWYEEKANIYEDYKKLFAGEPGKVQGIGILTSSDSTRSVASADYDDFVLLP